MPERGIASEKKPDLSAIVAIGLKPEREFRPTAVPFRDGAAELQEATITLSGASTTLGQHYHYGHPCRAFKEINTRCHRTWSPGSWR